MARRKKTPQRFLTGAATGDAAQNRRTKAAKRFGGLLNLRYNKTYAPHLQGGLFNRDTSK